MARRIVLALVLTLAGCGGPPPLLGEAQLDGLTTQEIAFLIRFPRVVRNHGEIAVFATITAPGAEWASLRQAGFIAEARRMDEGVIELALDRDYYEPIECDPSGCERRYIVRLDEVPTMPWTLAVTAMVEGELPEGRTIQIVAAP